MRLLFVLGSLAVVGLVVTGAIKLQKTNSTISIQIDKQRVAEEAHEFVEKAGDVLEDLRESFDNDHDDHDHDHDRADRDHSDWDRR